MTVEDFAVLEIAAAAVGVTLFVITWASLAPWYRSVFGWALMTGEVALALILSVALYAHWAHRLLPPWLVLTLYGFIALGCWLRFTAVIWEQFIKRRRRS